MSVSYASVYTSPSINRVSVCISISSVCYTSFGHFHCSVLRSVPPYVSFVILIAVIVILVIVIFVSFCLFVSFLFFRRFLPSVCLSDFQSLPPYVHIYHIIYIQGSSRHLTSQKLVRCVRADISSERAARACERVSIASERKEQKTHTTTYIRGSFLHQRPPRNIVCERLDSSTNERLAHASE